MILDECLPKRLARHLDGYDVATVVEAGFSGLSNGRLLEAIQDEFDAFLTIDSNLEYQQTLRGRPIRIVVIRSVSNRLDDLIPLAPGIIESLEEAREGEITHAG